MKKFVTIFGLVIGLGLFIAVPQGDAQGSGMMGGQGGNNPSGGQQTGPGYGNSPQ
jgi:hypothetical protein